MIVCTRQEEDTKISKISSKFFKVNVMSLKNTCEISHLSKIKGFCALPLGKL